MGLLSGGREKCVLVSSQRGGGRNNPDHRAKPQILGIRVGYLMEVVAGEKLHGRNLLPIERYISGIAIPLSWQWQPTVQRIQLLLLSFQGIRRVRSTDSRPIE